MSVICWLAMGEAGAIRQRAGEPLGQGRERTEMPGRADSDEEATAWLGMPCLLILSDSINAILTSGSIRRKQ